MQPLKAGFRWYGDNDEVPLEFIAQSGAKSVFTSLHQIPYGEVWSVEDIAARQEQVASYGLEWDTVESVPVSEDIKLRSGDFERHINRVRRRLRRGQTPE